MFCYFQELFLRNFLDITIPVVRAIIPANIEHVFIYLNQGWRQETSDRGADASDEGANYFGTRALKPDRS